eukprot:scaffold29194_cov122-Isochrysis_galbana.AAC.1
MSSWHTLRTDTGAGLASETFLHKAQSFFALGAALADVRQSRQNMCPQRSNCGSFRMPRQIEHSNSFERHEDIAEKVSGCRREAEQNRRIEDARSWDRALEWQTYSSGCASGAGIPRVRRWRLRDDASVGRPSGRTACRGRVAPPPVWVDTFYFFFLLFYLAIGYERTRAQLSATLPGPGKVSCRQGFVSCVLCVYCINTRTPPTRWPMQTVKRPRREIVYK